jgi:hypothetical protein
MVLIIYLFLITKAWLHHLPLIRNFLNPAPLAFAAKQSIHPLCAHPCFAPRVSSLFFTNPLLPSQPLAFSYPLSFFLRKKRKEGNQLKAASREGIYNIYRGSTRARRGREQRMQKESFLRSMRLWKTEGTGLGNIAKLGALIKKSHIIPNPCEAWWVLLPWRSLPGYL